jgi:hypothetical protein
MSLQVEHKTEKGTVCFQKVNDAQTRFDVKHGYLRGFDKYGVYETIKLSSDDWQLIGLTSEVTEEILKDIGFGYADYIEDGLGPVGRLVFRLDSFKSLMQFKNIPEQSVVLFKLNY